MKFLLTRASALCRGDSEVEIESLEEFLQFVRDHHGDGSVIVDFNQSDVGPEFRIVIYDDYME